MPQRPAGDPARRDIGQDSLIMPGGQVDPDALRTAWEQSTGDEPVTVQFELNRDRQSRLDKYLTQRVGFLSRTQVQRLIDDSRVQVNGRTARASTKLRLGDRVEVVLPPPPSSEILAEQIPLDVLHEDDVLVVLNKSPDIIVHPARGEISGTLINALAWHFQNDSQHGGELSDVGSDKARPGVVHRLDRDTTGCIVFAKDDQTHWQLARQFELRSVDKRYLALVHGRVEPEEQVIDLPLGPHPSKAKGQREKQVVRHDDLGKHALTICRVRERYADPSRSHPSAPADHLFTLVELELKTGRTHQIRVHLSHLGFPIVGDDLYAGRPFEIGQDQAGPGAPAQTIRRQMLHAALLSFEHPSRGEAMTFCAPPPSDFQAMLRCLRAAKMEYVHTEQSVPLERFGL